MHLSQSILLISAFTLAFIFFIAMLVIFRQKQQIEKEIKFEEKTNRYRVVNDLDEQRELSEEEQKLEKIKSLIFSELRMILAASDFLDDIQRKIQSKVNRFDDLNKRYNDVLKLEEIDNKQGAFLKESYKDLIVQYNDNYLKLKTYHNKLRKTLDQVLEHSENATDILLEDDFIQYSMKEFNLNRILENLIEKYRVFTMIKEIDFKSNLDDNIPSMKMDPHKIDEIFELIISNSIKLLQSKESIELTSKLNKQNVIVRLKIPGSGFSDEEVNLAFKKIEHKDKYSDIRVRDFQLFKVKKIVEDHGGNISLISGEEKGAEFIINLPTKHK